jgi:hypothetical protein
MYKKRLLLFNNKISFLGTKEVAARMALRALALSAKSHIVDVQCVGWARRPRDPLVPFKIVSLHLSQSVQGVHHFFVPKQVHKDTL